MAPNDINVQRRKRLLGWEKAQRRAWLRVCIAITIAHFARLDKCRNVRADTRPPETLGDAAQLSFVTVVCGFMESANRFFSHHGWHDHARKDGALIAMFQ